MKRILFGFLIAISCAGCLKGENNTTCNYNACSLVAPASEIQAVQNYLSGAGITGAQQHCSGAFYIIDEAGTGATPTACSRVNATYTGKFTNGSQFDAATADFGLQQVITGWTNTIPLIKAGGRIRLFIPPSLGYGPNDYRGIPGNSILIFDVQLNRVY